MSISFNIISLQLELSDERTIRDDLVIREGSSPEARKGLRIFQEIICLWIY